MHIKLHSQVSRWFVAAGLLAAVGAASAAGGITVYPQQESLVKVGMTQAEVRQALGRPSTVGNFHNEPGPTWTYEVGASSDPMMVFDVDFGSDGKVISSIERIEFID